MLVTLKRPAVCKGVGTTPDILSPVTVYERLQVNVSIPEMDFSLIRIPNYLTIWCSFQKSPVCMQRCIRKWEASPISLKCEKITEKVRAGTSQANIHGHSIIDFNKQIGMLCIFLGVSVVHIKATQGTCIH